MNSVTIYPCNGCGKLFNTHGKYMLCFLCNKRTKRTCKMCNRVFFDNRVIEFCYGCESNVVEHVPQLPGGPPVRDNEAMIKLFRDFLAQQKN